MGKYAVWAAQSLSPCVIYALGLIFASAAKRCIGMMMVPQLPQPPTLTGVFIWRKVLGASLHVCVHACVCVSVRACNPVCVVASVCVRAHACVFPCARQYVCRCKWVRCVKVVGDRVLVCSVNGASVKALRPNPSQGTV